MLFPNSLLVGVNHHFFFFWLRSFYKASVKASQPKNVVKLFNDNSEDFSMVMDVPMLMYMVLVENIS